MDLSNPLSGTNSNFHIAATSAHPLAGKYLDFKGKLSRYLFLLRGYIVRVYQT